MQPNNGFTQTLNQLTLTIDEPQIGDSIGQLQITNPAPNTTYVYHFGTDSTVNATFNIDTLTGVFWVKNNAWLDADKFSQVNFGGSAKVLGSGINSFAALITINLNDVAEPVYAGFGKSINFSGTEYITANIPTLPQGNSQRTMEAWVKNPSSGVIFNFGSDATNQRVSVHTNGSRIGHVGQNNDTWGSISINDGKWHHIAITFDGENLKQYIDGVLDYDVKNEFNTTGFDFYVASRLNTPGSEMQSGQIDEIAVWNYALSIVEIQNHIKNKIDKNSDGLVTFFDFEPSSDYTTADKVSYTNHEIINSNGSNFAIGAPDEFAFYLDKSYTESYTVGFLNAFDPDNSNLFFSHLSGGKSIFQINGTTGEVKIKSGVLLDTVSSTFHNLEYRVLESGDGSVDTGFVQINISDSVLFLDTTISINQLTQNFTQLLQKQVKNPIPTHSYNYSIVSGDPNSFFELDSVSGSLIVINSDSLLFANHPNLTVEIESSNKTNGKKDTCLITINVLNSGAPVYAGYGNAIKPQSGDIDFNIPAPNSKGNSIAMWINPHTYTNQVLFSFQYFIFQLEQSFLRLHTHPNRLFPNTFPLNEWTHLAVTYYDDRNSQGPILNTKNFTWKIYLNGNLTYEFTYPMGYQSNYLSDFASYDELSLWNKVLNDDEVKSLMNGQINLSDTTLQFYSNGNQKVKSTLLIDNSPFSLNGNIPSPNEEQFTGSKNQEFFISTKTSTTDTIGFAIGYQPNGLPINFSLLNPAKSKFQLDATSGALTIKHPDSLAGITDSTLINVEYIVTESTYNGTDTATMEVLIIPKFSIADDTISIEDRPLLGTVLKTVEIENQLPLTEYVFSFLPATNYSFLIVDSAGKIRVENPDTILSSFFNPITVQIEVTESPSGNKDTATITFNIIDSTTNIYAGLGHFLRVNDEEVVDFPLSKLSTAGTDRTISFWLEVTNNSFEFYLDGFRVNFNTSYNLFAYSNYVLGYNNFNPITGPNHVTIVTSTSKGKSFIYINGKKTSETNSAGYAFNGDGKNSIYSNITNTIENYIALSELAVWDVALTDSAVERMYKLGIDRNDTNLVRYHPMNQIDENGLIIDYSPNAYHATISNKSFANWQNIEDTISYTLSKIDTNDIIGFAKVWEPKNDSIGISLIGPNASDFQINADNSITINQTNNLPNDTSIVKLSYVATDLVAGATDTFSYNITVLPATEAYDTVISMPEDTLLGTVFFDDLLTNKNPNLTYNYEIVYATQWGVFEVGDTSGKFKLLDRDEIFPQQAPQNEVRVKITNQLGFLDTAIVNVNYIDKVNEVFTGFGKAFNVKAPDFMFSVEFEDSLDLLSQNGSWEFWSKVDEISLSKNHYVFEPFGNSYIRYTNGGYLYAYLNGNISKQISQSADTNWHHFAITYSKPKQKFNFYYDGDSVNTAPSSVGFNFLDGFTTANHSSRYFENSGLDNLKIYGRQLSSEEIKRAAHGEIYQNNDSLLLFLNFDQPNEVIINNLAPTPYYGLRLSNRVPLAPTDQFRDDFFGPANVIIDTITQAVPAFDTIAYAQASTYFNNSKFSYTKLPGNTDFQYFDLDSTTGLISISPYADFSGVNGLLTLNYLATDLTETSAFDTGTVYVYIKADSTQYANTRFDVSELALVNDTIGKRVVTNPDSTTTYSYSIIAGNIGNTFGINSINGTFYVANADSLDYDKYQEFSLTAVANGNAPSTFTDTATITINVLPLGNPPPFAGFGNALEFDGVDDYINLGNDSSLTIIENGTWAGWFYFDQLSDQTLFSKFLNSYFTDGYYMNYFGSALAFSQGLGNTTRQNWSENNVISINKWHHIAYTKKGSKVQIYVDGFDVTRTNVSHSEILENEGDLIIGAQGSNGSYYQFFKGKMDEIAIFNRALTSGEIFNLKGNIATINLDGLISYLDFNQIDSINKVYDEIQDTSFLVQNMNGGEWTKGYDTLEFNILKNVPPNYFIAKIPGEDLDLTANLKFNLLTYTTNFNLSQKGSLTIKNSSLFSPNTNYSLLYSVEDLNDNKLDSGYIKINIFETPEINDTTISINQLTQNYQIVVDLEVQKISQFSEAVFTLISTNAPGVLELDTETGTLSVANSDSLQFSKYPQIIEVIEVHDPLTNWRDTITVTINVLNSGAPIYAGLGNSLVSSEPVSFFNTPVENVFSWHRPMSVSLWVNPQNYGTLFNLYGLEVIMNTNTFVIKSTHPDANFPQFLSLNEWAYLTITFQGFPRIWKVYKNGQYLYQEERAHSDQNLSSDFVPSNTPFDELTVWKRPLTQTQIIDAYRGRVNVADTNLLIYANNNQPNNSHVLDNLADTANLGSISSAANSTFSSSINQLYTVSNRSTVFDTLAYGIGFQPNGIDFTFSNANPTNSKFNINPSTGGITVKHQDSLAAYANDTITFAYVVQESLFGGSDTAAIDFVVIPKFSIENDTLSVEEKPLLGQVIKTVEIIDPLPFESYDFEFSSATNYSFLSIDSFGKIRVEVPDSFVLSNFSTLNLEVIATEESTSKKDTANIHLILKDTTSNIYAGHGNFLRINDGEGIDFPSVNRQNWKGRTMSFWLEMTDNSFNFNLDKINVNLNTSYDIYAGHVIVGQEIFYPDAGPSHICVVFEQTGSPLVYRNGEFIGIGRDFGTNDDTLSTSVDNLQDDYLAISDLAVWKTPLSESEISEVLKFGINRNDTNLVRYYPMNQVDENGTILDYSGNGLHAQIVNRQLSNWINLEDSLTSTLSIVDTNFNIGYAKGWEPKHDSIAFSLIGPNASNFEINADNSITINPNNTLPNDTSFIKLSYVATDLVGVATDTFSYNLTILPATEAYDTVISMPEDTFLGSVLFKDLLTYKNPNLTYNYEIVYATQWGIFEVGDTSGNFILVDRDEIFPQQVPQNEVKVRITNSLGFVDTAIIKVNYVDKVNKVFTDFGNSAKFDVGVSGFDGEIIIDHDTALSSNSFSIEFIAKTNTYLYPNFNFLFFSTFNLYARVTEDANTGQTGITFDIAGSSETITLGIDSNFHHYSFIKDRENNRIKFFFDGKEIVNKSDFSAANIGSRMVLGNNSNHPGSGPVIDEFRIWTEAKTKSQIQSLKFNKADHNNEKLWLYLNFDQVIEDSYINNLTSKSIGIERGYPNDPLFIPTKIGILDTISQAISASDTIGYTQASTFFKNSKFQFTKLPGNTDFQYFDLNDSTGAITVSPQTDFSGITGLLELNYLATDLTEPNAFDTGTVYVFVDSAARQLAPTRFVIDENPNIGDTIGFRRVLNPDSNTTYTYHIIGGNIGNSFGIDTLTSEIYIVNNDSIDNERYPQMYLHIEARGIDTSNFVDSAIMTIQINDLVEPVYANLKSSVRVKTLDQYSFNGTLIPNFVDRSFMMWMKNKNQPLYPRIFQFDAFFIDYSFSVPGFVGVPGTNNWPQLQNDTGWVHIAQVYEDSTTYLYLNGEMVFSQFHLTGPADTINYIGNPNAGQNSGDGFRFDEIALWDRALSSIEVKSKMLGIDYKNENNLLAFYDMNRFYDGMPILKDLTGNGNDLVGDTNTTLSFSASVDTIKTLISENIKTNTSVGFLPSFDDDFNNIKYQLIGGDTDYFTIDTSSGEIFANANFDYFQKNKFILNFSTQESGDLSIDNGFIQIGLIDGPDLKVYSQGPGYEYLPQKQYLNLPVTIYNESPTKYSNQYSLNVDIDGTVETISLDSLNGLTDTTLFFSFANLSSGSFSNHSIKTYFSFNTSELYPFSDTIVSNLNITDTLLARSLVSDTINPSILLGVFDTVPSIDVGQMFGVVFSINKTDTLNSVELNLEDLTPTDSFNLNLYSYNGSVGNMLETKTLSFSDTTNGFKKISLGCINELDSGSYLLAFGKLNNNGNIAKIPTTTNNFDSTAFWLFDSVWNQATPTAAGYSSLPLIKWNFNRSQTYPNLISTYTDSAYCDGNRHIFFKDSNFNDSITWNNTIGEDTLVNFSSQWIYAEHEILNSGCSYYDSIYSEIADVKLFANATDSITLCEADSFGIHANSVYDVYAWKLNDTLISFADSVLNHVFDTAGFYSYTTEASNQNSTCFQNDTLTYTIQDRLLAILDSLPAICGNDSTLNLIGFVNDTLLGSFNGPGTNNFGFNPQGLAVDSTYQIIYSRTTTQGCFHADTSFINVGAFPIFSYNNFTPELCDYDSLNLDSTYNASPYNGYYSGLGVSGRTFKLDSANTFGLKYYRTDTLTNNLTCTDSLSLSIKVNFTPEVSIDLGFDRICVDSSNFLISGGLPAGSGGVYTGISINSFGNQYFFYPPLADSGNHEITYIYTTTDGCVDFAKDSIRVDTLPKVTILSIPPVCVGADTFHLTQYGIPLGGYFTGNAVRFDSSASTYYFDPSLAAPGASNVIDYFYSQPTSGCSSSSNSVVTLNQKPVITFTALPTFCIEDAAFVINQFSPLGGFFSGNGLDSMNNNIAFFSDSAGVGSHNIKYTYTDVNGCTDSILRTAVVNPLPQVTFSIDSAFDTLCFTNSVLNFPLNTGLPSGGTYSGNNVSFGFYNQQNVSNGIDTIYYTYTDVNGCVAHDTSTLEIFALPQVSLSIPFDSVCNNESNLVLTGGTSSSTNIAQSIYKGQGVNSGNFEPSQISSGVYNIFYVVEDIIGCKDSTSQSITITPNPNITFNTIPPVCLFDSVAVNANIIGAATYGFKVLGNTSNSIGTSNGVFHAKQTGLDSVRFTLTDFNGCSDSTQQSIFVDTLPNVTLGNFSDACRNGFPVNLNTGSPTGGVYTNNGNVLTGSIVPNIIGGGTHQIIYTFTDLNACSSSDTNTITINLPPSVSISSFDELCIDGDSVTLRQGSPAGGVYSANQGFVNDSVFNPTLLTSAGLINIFYTYVDNNGCDSTTSRNLRVNDLPQITFNPNLPTFCSNYPVASLSSYVSPYALPPLGYFTGNGIDSLGNFNPATSGIGGHNISYHFTDTNGCSNENTASVIVNSLPTPILSQSETQVCLGDSAVLEVQGGIRFLWETGDTSTSITVSPDSAAWFSVTITDVFSCSSIDSILQDVYNSFFIRAEFDSASTELNTVVTIDLLANDRGNISKYLILDGPYNGAIDVTFNPELDYTPNPSFRRVDSLIYQLCDDFCPTVCDTGLVKIKVFGNPNDFIPDGFSPNGDGMNDAWFVPGIELYPNNQLIIINRWGDVVFEAAPYTNNWEGESGGTLSFGGKNLPDGTYFYILKLDKDDPESGITGVIEMRR